MSDKKYPSGKTFSDDSPFVGAIPGMSLTYPQKSFPWDRPPTIVNPEEAKDEITKRMSDPEIHKYVVRAIDYGTKPETIGRIIADTKVMDGTYNPDLALFMRDYATVHVLTLADELGMSIPAYDESKQSKISAEDLDFVKSDMFKEKTMSTFEEELSTLGMPEEVIFEETQTKKGKGLMSSPTEDKEIA
jgi:hypothetical protein|tara:strand:- start:5435 stop:6001 length:567 start_codon:yes stop_codon:yes gene_type:complete